MRPECWAGDAFMFCCYGADVLPALALSFFRFLHQESGKITIDNLDIGDLSLATLRSRLTILPQEAQLFSGSIRDNMDPFGQHEDVEIWEALRQCGLAGRTSANASRAASRAQSRVASAANLNELRMSGGGADEPEERVAIRSLDDQVAAGGKNFSEWRRQGDGMCEGNPAKAPRAERHQTSLASLVFHSTVCVRFDVPRP